MTTNVKISCQVSATSPGLNLSWILDDRLIWSGDPYVAQELTTELSDDDGPHRMIFELSGKTADHTVLDDSGNIVQDLTASVADIQFDGIKLGHLVVEKTVYNHDFNGSGLAGDHKFYGTLGCNGRVQLDFTTPIYLWLLENM